MTSDEFKAIVKQAGKLPKLPDAEVRQILERVNERLRELDRLRQVSPESLHQRITI